MTVTLMLYNELAKLIPQLHGAKKYYKLLVEWYGSVVKRQCCNHAVLTLLV
jgi:hypothetical protein